MSALDHALLAVVRRLGSLNVPHAVVGGIANAVWGEPRATIDVDVTVWVADSAIPGFIDDLAAEFRVLVEQPLRVARETRVVPLESPKGVRIDIILGLLPFEKELIDRAVTVDVAGSPVRFVTAEDLILMKIISERPRDLEDARGVTRRRLKQLDLAYLEPRIEELSRLLERPEIRQLWRAWKAQQASRTVPR